MPELMRSAFEGCCGIEIVSEFPNKEDYDDDDKITNKEELTTKGNGITLVALNHEQWTEENLSLLKKAGFKPAVEDFHNSLTGNRITLFAKHHNPTVEKKQSYAWTVAKKFFGR